MRGRDHISLLINMSLDNRVELYRRRDYLYDIGLSKGLSKNLVDYLMNYPDPLPNFSCAELQEKFECLYTAVQFMKYGRKIRRKEIRFCEYIAIQMGYFPQVIFELSAFIYGDPNLSVNRKFLQQMTQIYLMSRRRSDTTAA